MGIVDTVLAPGMKLRSTTDSDLATKGSELTYTEMDDNLIALKNAFKQYDNNGFEQFTLYNAAQTYSAGNLVRFYDGTYWGLYRAIAGIAVSQSPAASPGLWKNLGYDKLYVDASVIGKWRYMADIDASTNPNYPATVNGAVYRISVAGKVGGTSGKNVYVDDFIVAYISDPAVLYLSGDEATTGAGWKVISGINHPPNDGIISVKVSLASSDILTLNTTPFSLIPAPGAGNFIQVLSVYGKTTFVTTSYTCPSSDLIIIDPNFDGYFVNSGGNLGLGGNRYFNFTSAPSAEFTTTFENSPILLWTGSGDPTSGDSTLDIYLIYKIVSI